MTSPPSIVRLWGAVVAQTTFCDDRVTSLKHAIWTNLSGFVTGSYVTRDLCDRAFERMHARDRIGDRIHLVLACLAMIGILGPVSVVDILVLPMVVFFLVRVLNTFPVWIHGFGQPIVLASIMLAALMGVSLLWSESPRAGLEHMSELRWFAMIGFVYPVIEHRRVLIACLCIGFLIGNGSQLIDAFNGFGNPWLADRLWHEPDRISGWWDPAVGGSVLVAGLGLHLPAAMMGRGRCRVLGLAGTAITLVALVATGTRGAWIAAVLLMVFAFVVAFMKGRSEQSRKGRAGILAAGLVLVVVIGAGVLARSDSTRQRVESARAEIARAMEGDFSSSTGARVSMANQALRAGFEHPAHGLGAGGFRDWMETQTAEPKDDHAHAHSSVLQIFAENGIPGVAMLLLIASVVLVNSWRCGIETVGERWGYSMGPFFAAVGLLLISAFDSVLINVHTMALLGALAALSPAYLPKPKANPRANPNTAH